MSGSDDLLKQKLRKIFNLKHFVNTNQKDAVKAILKRDKDVVVSMGPGSRKSLCFQLPGIMHENKVTIVCSASTSSIKNQIYYLKKSKIGATLITAELGDEERERLKRDVTSDKPTTRFIYVKPELVSSESFIDILHTLRTNDKLAYFAVDDAHSASPQHRDYCEDYLKFGSLRPAHPSVPWITLTHSASPDVRNDIVRNLQLREPIATFAKSTFRKNLHHDIIFKNTIRDLFTHLKNFVTSRLETDGDTKKLSGIIYCKNRETVDMVAGKLSEIGLSTKAHHGGMSSKDKKKVLDDWLTGALPVVTATTSFGDGIEKSSVRVVVHFDVPQSIARFYKESGIAGRDGKLSFSRIYYCKTDVTELASALKSASATATNPNAKRKALRTYEDFMKMTYLCETVDCRHKIFSNCFGDTEPNCKDKCDVCTNPPTRDNDGSNMATLTPVIIKSEPYHPESGQSSEHREPQAIPTIRPSRSVSPTNTIIIKEETATANQANHSNLSDELFSMKTQPPRNVSPTRTIIKEEPVTRVKQEGENNSCALMEDITLPQRCVSPAETVIDEKPFRSTAVLSDELFAMKTLPPRDVSPARTIVKEETEDLSNRTDRPVENSGFGVLEEDTKSGIKLLSPLRRCVSPAETVIDEKPVLNTPTAHHDLISPISNSSNATNSGRTTPQSAVSSSVNIKSEPKSPVRPINGNNGESLEHAIRPLLPVVNNAKAHYDAMAPISNSSKATNSADAAPQFTSSVIIKSEPKSPVRPINGNNGESLEHAISPLLPVVNNAKAHYDAMAPISNSSNATNSADAAPQFTSSVIIKSEPKSPVRPINGNNGESLEHAISPLLPQFSSSVIIKNEPKSPVLTQNTNLVSATTITSDVAAGISTVIKREAPISDRQSRSPSPTGTIVKDECLSPARNTDFDEDVLENLSDISQDGEGTLNVNSSRDRGQNSKKDKLPNKFETTTMLPADNLEMIRDSSSEPEFVSSEIVEFREKSSSRIDNRNRTDNERLRQEKERRGRSRSHDRVKREKNVRKRSRSRSLSSRRSSSQSWSKRRSRSGSKERLSRKNRHSLRSRSGSRSQSNDQFKREKERFRRSRSNDRVKRKRNVRRRSRSRSLSSRRSSSQSLSKRGSRSGSKERSRRKNGRSQRSCSRSRSRSNDQVKRERNRRRSRSNERFKREKDRRRRSRSNERMTHENSVDQKPSSSNSIRSQTSSRSEQMRRRQQYSNDSESDVSNSGPSTSASTRNKQKVDSQWSNRQFSVTPERRAEDDEDNRKPDYGWEDPAPPKPKLEERRKVLMDNAKILENFESKLDNGVDFDLEAETKRLCLQMSELAAKRVKQKVDEMDEKIRKKQDEHMLQLFGTTNFDSWDDDPALSNMNTAKQLHPIKAQRPDNIPLYKKMTLEYEVAFMKLMPTRAGDEVIFSGNIREVEDEYRGQDMPRHVVDQIKQEKVVIADLVSKYLMPYYNNERIQPKDLFPVIARKISHHFYQRRADENAIRRHVEKMFVKYGTITESTNLE